MRYVVTGSAGFIGRHVATELLERGHEVVGLDAFTDYYDPSLKRANDIWLAAHSGYRGIELDICVSDLDEIIDGADVVIHLAGQPGVRLSWADHFDVYVQRNIIASHRVLEAARRARVRRLVLASSSSVYGNAATFPTDESCPTRPFSPYGVTKLAMENLANAYSDNWGVRIAILRYFTVYGPGQRPDMAMHRFITHASDGEPIVVYGDGEQVRDFTYATDAALATVEASVADLPTRIVLNIAGGAASTVNNVVRLVSESVGRDLITSYASKQPGDVQITGGSIDRARRLLGWEPAVPLDEGIKRQVAHQLGGSRVGG